eukprot:scaffold118184_cov23-Cyclotella_meneghiniana.AAC.2
MRKRAAEHPLLTRNLTNVHDFGFGRALRSDAHGDVADAVPRGIILLEGAAGRSVQLSTAGVKVKKSRATSGHMCCEECSAAKGGT